MQTETPSTSGQDNTQESPHSQPETQVRRTALYEAHRKLAAKFTEFSGWQMPVSYSGLIDEHKTVRSALGLFDVSHMGEVWVSGEQAEAFLQYVCSNDLTRIASGQAQYNLLLNDSGGVVDDIIVYKYDSKKFFLCVNAGNAGKDWQWLSKKREEFLQTSGFSPTELELENVSDAFGQVAIQGPRSRELLSKLFNLKLEDISPASFPAFTFRELPRSGATLIVACTGYTGEDGFEVFCPVMQLERLWEDSLAAGQELGIKPIGLGARDTLRLEVCYPLHGHELSEVLPATACGVSWVISFNKPDFIGKAALLEQKGKEKQVLVGLEVLDKGIAREGARIFSDDSLSEDFLLGQVSSGTLTPSLGKAVALGFVPKKYSAVGTKLFIELRGRALSAEVVKRPFYVPVKAK